MEDAARVQGRHDRGGALTTVIAQGLEKVGDSVCILRGANRSADGSDTQTETSKLTEGFWLEPPVGRWCHLQWWRRNRGK